MTVFRDLRDEECHTCTWYTDRCINVGCIRQAKFEARVNKNVYQYYKALKDPDLEDKYSERIEKWKY